MKRGLYAAVLLGLVPLQATVLPHATLLGVRPDLCFIAVFLIGFLKGESKGALAGLGLGFIQDLFSATPLWLNVMTKGALGLLAGLLGRHLANATVITVFVLMGILSILSGVVFGLVARIGDSPSLWLDAVQSIILPEAFLNAVLGALIYFVLPARRARDDVFGEEIHLFGRS
ncbi:rod shape-determining protein MreD [Candidatus Nitrospira bockiana]